MTAPARPAPPFAIGPGLPAHGGDRPGAVAETGTVVTVDARGLLSSGIGRYLREIIAHLFRDDRFAEVRLLGDPRALREFCASAEGGAKARIIPYPFGFYSPHAQLAWLRVRNRALAGAHVVFFPHYDVPLGLPSSSVVTVHDLTHFRLPEHFSAWRRIIGGALLHRAVTKAGRVAVVSTSTAGDLVTRIPKAAPKIRIIPQGVSSFFRPVKKPLPAGMYTEVAVPFLLCVGNRKPHKNLKAAVEVLARVRAEVPELRLVVAGPVSPGWAEVLRLSADLGLEDAIVDLPFVSEERLRSLYQSCSALLFLSLYEGFGLPILEAMACGAPVIASNRGSMPEALGDAGILVPPDDYDGVAAAVLRILRDPVLAADLARRGLERAKVFTWESTGRQTADLLLEVAVHSRLNGGVSA